MRKTGQFLLVKSVGVMGLITSSLLAESVTFRNDGKIPLTIQVGTVQRGMLKRDQGTLRPGESTPKIALNADKTITISDSRSGRVLFRDALRVSQVPLNFSIVSDPRVPNAIRVLPIPTTMPTLPVLPGFPAGVGAPGGDPTRPGKPTRDPNAIRPRTDR